MHQFIDSKGRPWHLEINCDTVEEVKADCGVNLLDLADPDSNLLKELNIFPPLLAKLLFSALADQAKVKEVDAREFRRSMSGDAMTEATDALFAEIVLFCPKHRRSLLQAVLDKSREVEEAGVKLALNRLSDPQLQAQTLAAMDRQVTARIRDALESLDPSGPAKNPLVTGSSTSAGMPPDYSVSPLPALTPGDSSSGSPSAPGSPIAT
jgi:hypothetical protein